MGNVGIPNLKVTSSRVANVQMIYINTEEECSKGMLLRKKKKKTRFIDYMLYSIYDFTMRSSTYLKNLMIASNELHKMSKNV